MGLCSSGPTNSAAHAVTTTAASESVRGMNAAVSVNRFIRWILTALTAALAVLCGLTSGVEMPDRESPWVEVGRRDKDTAWTTPEGRAALSVKCIVCGAPVDRKCLNPARRELGPRKIWCLGRTSPTQIPKTAAEEQ